MYIFSCLTQKLSPAGTQTACAVATFLTRPASSRGRGQSDSWRGRSTCRLHSLATWRPGSAWLAEDEPVQLRRARLAEDEPGPRRVFVSPLIRWSIRRPATARSRPVERRIFKRFRHCLEALFQQRAGCTEIRKYPGDLWVVCPGDAMFPPTPLRSTPG